MAGSVNKCIIDEYEGGASTTVIAARHGLSLYRIRNALMDAGVLRTRKEALRLAGSQGRLGAHLRGRPRAFSSEHCANISKTKKAIAALNSARVSVKPSGYVEYTMGPNKGRSVHVVMMEERLGRRLLPDECVHHIDGDKTHNDITNFALMTRAAHARLHRREESLIGKERKRSNGRFS